MFPGLRNAFGSSIHPKYSGEHFTHELLCAGLSSELPCPVSLQQLWGEHLGHISLDIAPSLELPCSMRKQKCSGEHLGQTSGPPDFGHFGHINEFKLLLCSGTYSTIDASIARARSSSSLEMPVCILPTSKHPRSVFFLLVFCIILANVPLA